MGTIYALRTLLTGRLLPWAVIVFAVVGTAHAGTAHGTASGDVALHALTQRVAVLERACVPVATGGGVTQCAQPGVYTLKFARALRACMTNSAYIGVTQDDTWSLHAQCMDD